MKIQEENTKASDLCNVNWQVNVMSTLTLGEIFSQPELQYHAACVTSWNQIDPITQAQMRLSGHPASQQASLSSLYLDDYQEQTGVTLDPHTLTVWAERYRQIRKHPGLPE